MGRSRQNYMFNVLNFTSASDSGASLVTAGSWTQVGTYQHIRIGSIAFDTARAWGDPGLFHAFSALAQIPVSATMQFRFYDVDNAAALVSVSKTNNFANPYDFLILNTSYFDNLPSGNARIRLEYQLDTGTGLFYWATWAVRNIA